MRQQRKDTWHQTDMNQQESRLGSTQTSSRTGHHHGTWEATNYRADPWRGTGETRCRERLQRRSVRATALLIPFRSVLSKTQQKNGSCDELHRNHWVIKGKNNSQEKQCFLSLSDRISYEDKEECSNDFSHRFPRERSRREGFFSLHLDAKW